MNNADAYMGADIAREVGRAEERERIFREVVGPLVEALETIAYDPIGPSEASDFEVLRLVTEIASTALATARAQMKG